ncbi:MAG TPA: hypothetical protein VI389_02135, partial [Geobacteraceae bacterium]
EGYTGWLNKSSTAEELARIMIQIIDDPACIRPRNKWVVANRNQIIADRKEHIRVLMEGYAEAIAKHKGGR